MGSKPGSSLFQISTGLRRLSKTHDGYERHLETKEITWMIKCIYREIITYGQVAYFGDNLTGFGPANNFSDLHRPSSSEDARRCHG